MRGIWNVLAIVVDVVLHILVMVLQLAVVVLLRLRECRDVLGLLLIQRREVLLLCVNLNLLHLLVDVATER